MTENKISDMKRAAFRERLQLVAKDLRDMADSVERLSDRQDDYQAASEVAHIVLWGVANLGLDRFASYLGEIEEFKKIESGS